MLWRGKWLILAAVLVGGVLAVLVTKQTAKVYEANAVIQVNAGTTGSTNQSPSDVQVANQGLAETYATLLGDRSLLQEIRGSVRGGTLSTGELLSRVNAAAVTNTSLVDLGVSGSSPDDARTLANDIANAFVTYIETGARLTSDTQQSKLQDQISSLSRQIRVLQGQQQTSAVQNQLDSLRGARTSLQTQLASVIANGIQQGSSVRLVAPATGSAAPVSPRPMLNLIAGLLLGFLAGSALSWLRIRLDRGLHNAAEAEELLDAPTLASVPVRKRFSTDDPVLGEAFDVLRANLAFISHDGPLQVITLTSFNPREGKSSTVEGLAYAAARGGLSVVVVDGDVRTRTLSQRLGHEASPGLTNVVVGAVQLDEALVEIAPGITLLPSGPMPPNPPSLLSSSHTAQLIEDLRTRFSLVLIDSPPVAHLADASILASVSDGVVVVARVGVTSRSDLATAGANLRHSPTPTVGLVLLERRTIDETYYPAVSKGASAPRREPVESAETI